MELKNVAQSKDSLTDKAKDAASAIKDPGAPGPDHQKAPEKAPRQQPNQ